MIFFFISIAYITANLNHFPVFVSLNSTFRASCLSPFHKKTVMSDEHTESSQSSMQFVTTRLSIRENVRSIQKLTVLRVLRTVEQRGLTVLQIMLFFSWSVVCIESGSSQLLTTSYVEALMLTS